MGNLNDALSRRFLRLGLLLAMAICHTCHSCSPPLHWKAQEVSKRAAIAEIVIVGKVVRRGTSERKNGLYGARIEVLCVLKGGAQLPAVVEVLGFGRVAGHCVHSAALQNATYIAFLRQRHRRYFVAELNNQPGTVPFEKPLLRSIVKEIGARRHRCSNVFVKKHCNATQARMVVYRDDVKTKMKTDVTRVRTRPPSNLEDGSNAAAIKAKPIWGVAPMLMAMYFWGCLLT